MSGHAREWSEQIQCPRERSEPSSAKSDDGISFPGAASRDLRSLGCALRNHY